MYKSLYVAFFSALVFSFITATVAEPIPQAAPVFHCGGPNNLVCPTGFVCCGPFIEGVGGTCHRSGTVCPL
ncbi:hypothetical protein K435DRAFT_776721 [Dendrothele bispora CBS 962.96]|uniref:Uncharacterized protein n=1 Tax=Dendrothele bispora (strain CBS 962.96) TaxID=1314807 RepID=A0A4S8MDR6_DENBC|nr:hypothetical protein K435DRAFT_776721 [Dendrothele bispora CBS 962.96]